MAEKNRNSRTGWFGKILVMDCETSGLDVNNSNPSVGYQAVSWGLVIVDADSLNIIDQLYVEIKWNGTSKWEPKAERIHGLSKDYLEDNGVTEKQAITLIANFLYKFWDPTSEFSSDRVVRCAGHNVATFDVHFMRQLFDKFGLTFNTGNRFIDTSTLGWGVFDCYTSDEVFKLLGITRKEHNALEDAKASLEVLRASRRICNTVLNG